MRMCLTGSRGTTRVTGGRTARFFAYHAQLAVEFSMNILVRRTTIWAFAAFFSCVSLLGPGWHCVFGQHFHAEACTRASGSTSGCAADAHRHCCTASRNTTAQSTAAPSQTDALDRSVEPAFRSLAEAAHHCPLCQFFGTAQWSQVDAPPRLVLVVTELPIRAASSCEREAPRLYLSRAPPLALSLS